MGVATVAAVMVWFGRLLLVFATVLCAGVAGCSGGGGDALPDGVPANEVGAVLGTVWPQVAEMNAKPFKDTELTPAMRAAGRSPRCTSIAGWPR